MRSVLSRGFVAAALAVLAGSAVAPAHVAAWAEEEKPETAADLNARIEQAITRGTALSLNEALALLRRLEGALKDDAAREAVGYAALAKGTVEARDGFFRKELPVRVDETMAKLILAKARERKPDPVPGAVAGPAKGPETGSLAAARAWAVRDLPKRLWDAVCVDLELKADEAERFWKERVTKPLRTASYGSGSFIVAKANALPVAADQAKSADEWWDARAERPEGRAAWLTAYFVETSGLFEIRVDSSENCSGCGGTGFLTANHTDGTQSKAMCTRCRGATKVRQIVYR